MYHKWKLWCMVSEIWSVTDRIFLEFFLILGHFLPFYLTNNLKNENFEKMKKIWCMLPEIWTVTEQFFVPHDSPNNKNKKMKLEIPFYTCIPKIIITWCMVPEIRCAMDWCLPTNLQSFYYHFWHVQLKMNTSSQTHFILLNKFVNKTLIYTWLV